jgi:hypothetical protein
VLHHVNNFDAMTNNKLKDPESMTDLGIQYQDFYIKILIPNNNYLYLTNETDKHNVDQQ